MLVVQIEKPANVTLASWFSELRAWLDENRVVPLGFSRAGRRLDRVIYQISFREPVKAREFTATFARYAPTVRRPTLGERGELIALAGNEAAQ
jgi:hypothetical protein